MRLTFHGLVLGAGYDFVLVKLEAVELVVVSSKGAQSVGSGLPVVVDMPAPYEVLPPRVAPPLACLLLPFVTRLLPPPLWWVGRVLGGGRRVYLRVVGGK
jgi:hypothetical protein